ncbi:long-chain fatty acid--CoA ligase [Ornithinimicrobium sp. F0845]|uniref:AMP-dependent synthetase/ligase n=1 Tax=Ornithinimicrobium sp. F0845 TaxID=2926412 RepID=UPI001FF1C44C|nr:long-chain fatty acid--CoA ligase [Ornithinimicrobium sp. F0845]MCK0111236.1 long-chain fatty acid--CoA ligase [Ornithinimicrobium sp. F0845]
MALSAREEQFDQATIDNPATSVGHMFRERVATSPTDEAFRYPVGESWESLTWAETAARANALAAGLVDLGVGPEERVALCASTRLEWVLSDLAVMSAGAATTTIYPTTLSGDVAYIVADSGSKVVIAEDASQVAKLAAHRSEIPEVSHVVVIDGEGDGDWVITLSDLEERGQARLANEPGVVDERIDQLTPEHLATIIYTSGTTGRPKGVRLPHSAWTYEAAAVDSVNILSGADLQYLWLPLAHVFGKVLLVLPLQIGFPTAVDGRVDKIVENVAIVQPTFMGAAPRIFEKAYGRITMMMAEEGGIKEKLFHWATGVGRKVSELRQQGKEPTGLLAVQHGLADKLVLKKVQARFGGRVRFFISGSAALNRDVAEWFDAVGLRIIEGYGLTETSAASFVNRPHAGGYKFGSVGWALPGTEARIAEDGEILVRGPGVTSGYHQNEEATAEALGADGWFHTGDIGEIDDRGFLSITDRKKDLFKTSGGKYVAPSAIESMFKGICPYASQLVIEGDGRKFVSALVTLDPDAIAGWAEQNGLGGKEYAEIVSSPACREMVQGYIDELNVQLNRWEQVKQFVILDHDLTIEEGDLTPSMKLKRRVVTKKYSDQLDALYTD